MLHEGDSIPNRERQMSHRLELFELIGAFARRRYQAADRSYASMGLNHTEARLLKMLDNEGGVATQDALSRRIFVDRSNAGRAFKRLEQAGYIGRRKDDLDNRTNFVDITPKGREAAAEVNRLSNEMARTFFGDLTEADAATIATLLRKAL
jgi:DNA-binding MarR family transcriptional regulator